MCLVIRFNGISCPHSSQATTSAGESMVKKAGSFPSWLVVVVVVVAREASPCLEPKVEGGCRNCCWCWCWCFFLWMFASRRSSCAISWMYCASAICFWCLSCVRSDRDGAAVEDGMYCLIFAGDQCDAMCCFRVSEKDCTTTRDYHWSSWFELICSWYQLWRSHCLSVVSYCKFLNGLAACILHLTWIDTRNALPKSYLHKCSYKFTTPTVPGSATVYSM